jgi:hypothetical protein
MSKYFKIAIAALGAILIVIDGSVSSSRAQDSDTQPGSDVQTHYLAMRQAYCTQDWNEAIRFSDLLLNSDALQPDYREMLLSFRERLQTYQETEAQFESISGCEPEVDVSPSPTPTPTPQVSNEPSPTPTPQGNSAVQSRQ